MIVYKIFSYIPKFSLTPKILKRRKLEIRVMSTVKRNISLFPKENKDIHKFLMKYKFNDNKFEFSNRRFYLTVYLNQKDDYLVIFY